MTVRLLQAGAAFQLHLDEPAFGGGGHQCLGALQVHDVHLVVAHMALHGGGKLRAFGVLHRDEVLDSHGVEHLAAKALGGHAGADALARRVHGSRCAGRAAADDEHIKRLFGVELGGVACAAAGVEFGDDFGQLHAALAEALAVQKHGGHAHDFARLDFALEHAAVDGGVGDARVEHAHEVERLHHVRAVVALRE